VYKYCSSHAITGLATYLLIVEYFWLFKNFMKKKNAIAQCISFMYYSGKIG
jgi:hypothetical protein